MKRNSIVAVRFGEKYMHIDSDDLLYRVFKAIIEVNTTIMKFRKVLLNF